MVDPVDRLNLASGPGGAGHGALARLDRAVAPLGVGWTWMSDNRSAIARMRDHLAHRYSDTDHAVVIDLVENELEPLETAVGVLAERANGELAIRLAIHQA